MLFGSLAPAPLAAPAPTTTTPAWIKERLAYFADPRFTFDPVPHEYRLGERVLTSCTIWLKDYTEPFVAAERAPGRVQLAKPVAAWTRFWRSGNITAGWAL